MKLGRLKYSSKYLAIQHFYTERHWSINWMCRQLGVTRAAYYKWLARDIPEGEKENETIAQLVCCICHNYDIPVHSPARFFQDFPRNIFLYRKRLSIPITTLSTINRMIRSAISLSIWTVASTILITNLDVISIIKTVVIINIAFFICGILHSTILQCWQ